MRAANRLVNNQKPDQELFIGYAATKKIVLFE